MNYWSKWLDYWLQQLKPSIPIYVKNGDQVLDEIEKLNLTRFALLFVTDAISMYNNIDTEHAITVITWWIKDFESKEIVWKKILDEFGHSEARMTTATTIPPSTSSPTTNLSLLQSTLNKLSKPSR